MGIKTEAEIEIEAPPEKVWEWITRRGRVAEWAGGDPDYMPTESSKLKAGYRGAGHFQTPDGPREIQFEVTAYEPPTTFAYRDTYDGGDQITTTTLEATGSGTRLRTSSDTDYAKMAMPAAAVSQLEKLPGPTRKMIETMIHATAKTIEAGGWDRNPMIRKGMKKATEQSLEKLKQLVEKDAD